MTEQNDFSIESNRIRTRLPGEVLNAYIDGSTNIINDLNLALSNVSDIKYENSLKSSKTNENYPMIIGMDQMYSTCIIKSSDLTINITGIKTSYNQDVQAKFCRNVTDGNVYYPVAANYAAWRDFVDGTYATTLPHTYIPGLFATVADPLNSSTITNSIAIGNSASQVHQTIDTPMIPDITRNYRTSDHVQLYNNFDGTQNPDTYNLNYVKQYCEFNNNITGSFYDYTTGQILPIYPNGVYLANYSKTVNNNFVTLDDVNECDFNPLSVHKRGRLFCPDRATYVFTKSVASYNYIVSADGQLFTVDTTLGLTKVLYTATVGNYQFPTNISNWEAAVNVGLPIQLTWFYYNKKKWLADENCTDEPDGQSLNISISITGIEGPILNPILHNTYKTVFSNSTTALLRFTMHSDIENYIFNNVGRLTNQNIVTFADPAVAGTVNTTTTIAPVYGNISASWSNSTVTMRQYEMEQLNSFQKKTTVLPYVMHTKVNEEHSVLTVPTRVDANDATSGLKFIPIKITGSSINIGDAIPKYVIIVIDTQLSYKFTSFQVTFNNTKPIILQDIQRLREASYKNGLNLMRDKYSIKTTGKCGFAFNGMQQIDKRRDVLILEYGIDIPLTSLMVPGLSNKNIKATYTMEVDFSTNVFNLAMPATGDSILNYNPQIIHLTEEEYIIEKNSSSNNSALFDDQDVIKSITAMEQIILGNKIRSSRAKLQGGGIFDMFSKLSSVVPKVIGTVNKVASTVGSVANGIGSVANGVKSFTGGNAYATGTTTQIPMSEILGRRKY